jgi:endonuclease YncB( thermonuclease family)
MQRTAASLCGLLLLIGVAHAEVLTGRVVAISEGDTITVLDRANKQRKIRLAGIDAPEKAQPFGTRARQHLSELIYLKQVDVEWRKYDRYGRIVGKIFVAPPSGCSAGEPRCPKTVDAGLVLVATGLAWTYKQYAKEQPPEERQRYARAEWDARAKRIGLWQDKNPVPPWEWRRRRRETNPVEDVGACRITVRIDLSVHLFVLQRSKETLDCGIRRSDHDHRKHGSAT